MYVYTFVVEYSGGSEYGNGAGWCDRSVQAGTEGEARRKLWGEMGDEERNAVSSIECVGRQACTDFLVTGLLNFSATEVCFHPLTEAGKAWTYSNIFPDVASFCVRKSSADRVLRTFREKGLTYTEEVARV